MVKLKMCTRNDAVFLELTHIHKILFADVGSKTAMNINAEKAKKTEHKHFKDKPIASSKTNHLVMKYKPTKS